MCIRGGRGIDFSFLFLFLLLQPPPPLLFLCICESVVYGAALMLFLNTNHEHLSN